MEVNTITTKHYIGESMVSRSSEYFKYLFAVNEKLDFQINIF